MMQTTHFLTWICYIVDLICDSSLSNDFRGKREPCEISFADFDGVSFRISSQPESMSVVKVNMAIGGAAELLRYFNDRHLFSL
jgi:hypothetical protein